MGQIELPSLAVDHVAGDKSPTQASDQSVSDTQTWKSPRINIARLGATYYAFCAMGLHDGALGALVPYLERYYGLGFLTISSIFITPMAGYFLTAFVVNPIHCHFGQRGIAILGPLCHLLSHIMLVVHPPFAVVPIAMAVTSLGHGLPDASWNAWVGDLPNDNELLGFLHASYGFGATLSPLLATIMITKAGLQWYYWYYVMIGVDIIELASSTSSFWSSTGAVYRKLHEKELVTTESHLRDTILRKPAARVSWLIALFLLCYVGMEVSTGGWIVSYEINVRHGAPFESGLTSTWFWLGITLGRMILGFVTPRVGIKVSIAGYLVMALGLELVIWLVPSFDATAIAAGFFGFFVGPVFPAAVVVCTRLLPKHLHLSCISFTQSVGMLGSAFWPFAVGAVAQSRGIKVLPPIVIALIAANVSTWLVLPKLPRQSVPADMG